MNDAPPVLNSSLSPNANAGAPPPPFHLEAFPLPGPTPARQDVAWPNLNPLIIPPLQVFKRFDVEESGALSWAEFKHMVEEEVGF